MDNEFDWNFKIMPLSLKMNLLIRIINKSTVVTHMTKSLLEH